MTGSMPHILMISRCPPYPLHFGDRLIVYHLARELSARGVTIDLLAFAEYASDWSLQEQQHYNSFFREMMLFDSKPRPLPEIARRMVLPTARFPKSATESFAPELWREIERWLARTSYDGVHLFGGIQVYEFKNVLGDLPTVITPYESYSLYTRRAAAAANNLREKLRFTLHKVAAHNTERWMYASYDVTTVVSESDRGMLLKLNPNMRVEVIPNGIDLSQFTLSDTPRKPAQLLFVGNYEYAPNQDAAMWLATDIFPRIQAQVPDATLWLVGNAPTPEMQALQSDSIHVTGRVPAIQPYLAESTAFICPLRVGAGIKNKVLEALGSGCPVVATPLSVEGITVTDGESVLLGDDAASLAAQTVKLLRDESLQDRIRHHARQVIETQYTWRGVAESYLKLYQSVGMR